MPAAERERLRELLIAAVARDLVDVGGRPLGEAASPLYATTEIEESPCPYSGARRGRPMNTAALRQMGGRWAEILADVAALRGGDDTLHGAWRACIAATAFS